MKHHTQQFRDRIIELRDTKSAREIAEAYGLTRNVVIGIWNRGNAGPIPNEQKARMSALQKKATQRQWTDPKFRNKVANSLSKAMRAYWADPTWRERQQELMRKAWASRP